MRDTFGLNESTREGAEVQSALPTPADLETLATRLSVRKTTGKNLPPLEFTLLQMDIRELWGFADLIRTGKPLNPFNQRYLRSIVQRAQASIKNQ